jgi:hypothetical protein
MIGSIRQAIIGCASRAGALSISDSAIARAFANVVMVRWASACVSAGQSDRQCAPRLERRAAGLALKPRKGAHGFGQMVAIPDHADMRRHHRAKIHLCRRGQGGAASRRRRWQASCRGQGAALDIVRDARGIDHCLEQRVRGQPVGAMRAGRGHFAPGPQAFDRAAAARIHGDAAHVIMRGRRHRDRCSRRIDAGCDATGMNGRESVGEARTERLSRIQKCTAARGDLGEHAARDDVARRQLGKPVPRRHEALASAIDQYRAFAAQRFGGEWRRIAADHDRGRVELHKLGIGDDSAGARGDREPKAACFLWVGRHRIEMADAAGCEHDGTGGDRQ